MNRDELIRALGEAIEDAALRLIGRDLGTASRDDIAAAGLDAVLPLVEADVRERIATKIEARRDMEYPSGIPCDEWGEGQWSGFRVAVRIARGADQ